MEFNPQLVFAGVDLDISACEGLVPGTDGLGTPSCVHLGGYAQRSRLVRILCVKGGIQNRRWRNSKHVLRDRVVLWIVTGRDMTVHCHIMAIALLHISNICELIHVAAVVSNHRIYVVSSHHRHITENLMIITKVADPGNLAPRIRLQIPDLR